jgi:hypothetical protein
MSAAREDIGEFIAFMAAEGAANLVAGRRGADAAEIARYAARAPFSLPPLVRGYLGEFGEHADGVVVGGDGSGRLADLLEYYDSSADEIPGGCAVICTPAIDAAVVLHHEGAGAPPTIRRVWSGAAGPVQAPSFAHHLYRSGWRCAHWPNREELTARVGLDELARYLAAIGCERLWFSGGVARCFVGDGVAIDVERAGDVTRVAVMGRLAGARERVARAVVRKTGARWLNAAR